MSALAKLYKSLGNEISGSDGEYSAVLSELNDLGINAYVGSDITIATQADIVVYSSAILKDDVELIACIKRGISCFERHIFLGKTARNFENVIAVSGTHGKTTTTGLIGAIFKNAELSATSHVGGKVKDLGGNFYGKGDKYFITEACEYKRSFLSLEPDVAVVLNIEPDHPDCYSDLPELIAAFAEFVGKVRKGGLVVVNSAIEYSYLHICEDVHIKTIGFDNTSDYYAGNIIHHNGRCEFDAYSGENFYAHIKLALYGRHNILNALASIAVAEFYKIDIKYVVKTLEEFKGIERRFEFLGELNGAKVYSDYAHHPSEIEATLSTAKQTQHRNLRVFFQPHTYSRTAKYFEAFSRAFKLADEISFIKTYAARETPDSGKTAFDLFYYVNANVQDARYFDALIDVAAYIVSTAMPDDMIMLLGAGDIEKVAQMLPYIK